MNEMNESDYNKPDGAIRSTAIKAGAISMAHMRHAMAGERGDSAALAFGRLAHMAILTPGELATQAVRWEGVKRGKAWEAFKDENAGKIILTQDDDAQLCAMQDAIRAHRAAHHFLAYGDKREVTLQWQTPSYGRAKARLDALGGGCLIEYKTTSRATPRAFRRQFFDLSYHLQIGWYLEGMEQFWKVLPSVIIIAQETTEPYTVGVYRVAQDTIRRGRKDAVRIAQQYRECEIEGVYPSPLDDTADESGVMSLDLPEYLEEEISMEGLE